MTIRRRKITSVEDLNSVAKAVDADLTKDLEGAQQVQPNNPANIFNFVKDFDKSIEKITVFLDMVFQDIEDLPQEAVDMICINASNWVNYWIERIRVGILNTLGPAKKHAKEVIDKYAPVISTLEAIEDPTPENIVEVVAKIVPFVRWFYEVVYKPSKMAYEVIGEVAEAMLSIADNLRKLAQYTPPRAKDINFNQFHIHVKTPTLAEIDEEGMLPYPKAPSMNWSIVTSYKERAEKYRKKEDTTKLAIDGDTSIA